MVCVKKGDMEKPTNLKYDTQISGDEEEKYYINHYHMRHRGWWCTQILPDPWPPQQWKNLTPLIVNFN